MGEVYQGEYNQQMDGSIPNDMAMTPQPTPGRDLFNTGSDQLEVIKEYNDEKKVPNKIQKTFWALASKSILLGFWEKEDQEDLYFFNNNILVGDIMSKPKHKYTFADRQAMNQMKLLAYANFKRSVGMEKWRINERTLQASAITQNINQNGAGAGQRSKGFLSTVKSAFM